MKAFSTYFRIMSAVILILLVMIGGGNWYYDPYQIYHFPEKDVAFINKPELDSHLRLHKAYAVKKIKPDSILIGTSRVLVGMDPRNSTLPAGRWYNLGLPGASMYEILRYIQHANAVTSLKTIVLDVEYTSFDPYIHHMPDFEEARLVVDRQGNPNRVFFKDYLTTLFSYDALKASLAQAISPKVLLEPILSDGSRSNVFRKIVKIGGHRELVNSNTEGLLTTHYQRRSHPVNVQQERADLYLAFAQIIRMAYRDRINLVMFVPPLHAINQEVRKLSGLWQDIKSWREKIVEINNNVAREIQQPPFPIWDFSGFNQYTEEAVPAKGELREMKWYWEGSHFRKELGDRMFKTMFAEHSANAAQVQRFGTLLDPNTILLSNRRLDEDEKNYSLSHRDEIRHLEETLRRISTSDDVL